MKETNAERKGDVQQTEDWSRCKDSLTPTLCSFNQAAPWLKQFVTGLSPRVSRFSRRPIHVGFVVDKVTLRQVICQERQFVPVNIISSML